MFLNNQNYDADEFTGIFSEQLVDPFQEQIIARSPISYEEEDKNSLLVEDHYELTYDEMKQINSFMGCYQDNAFVKSDSAKQKLGYFLDDNAPEIPYDLLSNLPLPNTEDNTFGVDATAQAARHCNSSVQNPATHTNQRNKCSAPKYGDRRDVIYKNLLRAVRTILCEQFRELSTGAHFSRKTTGCVVFKMKIEQFLEKDKKFKQFVPEVFGEGPNGMQYFTEVLSIFLEESWYYPNKRKEMKEATKILKKCTKSFTIGCYTKLFKFRGIQLFFNLLLKSGFIQEIINQRDNMQKCPDRYIEGVESIINFSHHPFLMK
ncbi:unnamed protein product [Moneuplotes crassus]|uniref:Uncharacterized protein n=1 Tax=Euplotes crassus TaxID=5936 RepID=A0AAD1Y8I0_EUPCR|nr:unnamed protein product [Moneuplotes crassus]